MRISDWSSDVCSSDLDANLVEAEIAALQDGQALVRIGAVERRLPARGLGPGAVKVAIRPEAIRIARNGSGGILEADVVKATYLGSHMEYTLTTPPGDLFAVDSDVDHPAHVGECVTVDLAKRGVPLVRSYRQRTRPASRR